MHQVNSIIMHAPRERVFETAADLEKWPTFLPHYRFIHYYERGVERNVVRMAARRDFIPISWVSEEIIDRHKLEVRFRHLKAWTKGMEVIWTFAETHEGVRVPIVHDLRFRVPALACLAEPIVGDFFIGHIASQTLKHMKTHVERA
jgi:ribosome-associated toxin RatA of RatAB toxin-antitoxin module